MDSLPTSHLSLPVLSGAIAGRAAASGAPLMSHFHWLFIDLPPSVVSPYSLRVLTLLCLCMERIIFETNSVPIVHSIIMVSKEGNEAYDKGSKVSSSDSCASASFVLFHIGIG